MTANDFSSRPRLTPSYQPRQVEKRAPCQQACPNCADIRYWINIIAQRHATGLELPKAYELAWRTITDVNPFPAVLGRICPHPCETECNREAYDGALSINAMERFLGDWAIEHQLAFEPQAEAGGDISVGVVGSGPSGLSFAYQMARRGYHVTLYEEHGQAGGMLRHGVPGYRLPRDVLDAEIRRILDLGVELRLETRVGRDITLEALRERHAALYLGLGAQAALDLNLPGEQGPGVWRGTDFLQQLNSGLAVNVGHHTVVIGGGNTAIDAARMARRAGAEVTIVYRRERDAMPAAPGEVEEAIAEGVRIIACCSPTRILRADSGSVRGIEVRRTQPGEPDASGRRSPVPVTGSDFTIPADTVIGAISQAPVLEGLESVANMGDWLVTDDAGYVGEGLLAGGDVLGLGIASNAVVQGRLAAEHLHARLSGHAAEEPIETLADIISAWQVDFAHKPTQSPARAVELPVSARLNQPEAEVRSTLSEAAFLTEVLRCHSCGICMGCGQCEMFCTVGSFSRVAEVRPGMYFSLALDACLECGKCVAVCPCGFLETV